MNWECVNCQKKQVSEKRIESQICCVQNTDLRVTFADIWDILKKSRLAISAKMVLILPFSHLQVFLMESVFIEAKFRL